MPLANTLQEGVFWGGASLIFPITPSALGKQPGCIVLGEGGARP